MKHILTILVLLLSFVSLNAQKDYINIVKDNKTEYVIILQKNAIQEEKLSAELLQQSLKKVFSITVPIFDETYPRQSKEFLIGNSRGIKNNKVDFRKETSAYSIVGEKIIFNGENTYYSVVDFLERELGVRKFAPDCEIYNNRTSFSLHKNTSYGYTSPNTFRQVNSTFTKRNKDFALWTKTHLYQETFAVGYFVHTASKLCSDKEYFKSHPEYFAMVNGKRVREQVCWSNDTVFEIMKKNLYQAMISQPDKVWWSVSQNDNDTYCQCVRCKSLIEKEGSPAAPIIVFVNRMAKAFPDKIISTLAYQYSRKCPKTLKPEKNVQIMLCTIEANRNITIEEEKQRNTKNSFAKDLEDWGKVSKNIFLWDYECDFAYYVSPFPNFHVLQKNIQYFVENGAFLQFQQANCQRGNDLSELKNYLLAKLLWQPYLNQDSVMNEFLQGYYGKQAGRMIGEYIKDIDSVAISYKDEVGLDIYGAPIRYAENILNEENLKRYDSILQIAEDLSQNNKTYLLRVQTVRLAIDYAIMEIAKADMYGKRGWYEKQNGKWVLKEDMQQRLEKFHSVCQQAKVENMNESGFKPEAYYKTTLRFIDNDIEDDLAFQKPVTAEPLPSKNYSKGDVATLTNGVKGASDYKIHWLGWQGDDFQIDIDLQQVVKNKTIYISSLNVPKSWILHPNKVTCLVSANGKTYKEIGTQDGDGNNRNNPTIKEYSFKCKESFRYVRIQVEGTHTLPSWHPSYTKKSWVFMDEIIVK
ncbi:MAG: DUF4838 domain-containing protein [Bacteroidales bacterium]|nr:DUF4838 domain-containing protein [Bacteroidales bacterium]